MTDFLWLIVLILFICLTNKKPKRFKGYWIRKGNSERWQFIDKHLTSEEIEHKYNKGIGRQ